ncbi:hypothetical protein [Flavobacterium sp. I3-2]|uniref:hypothetical protein n=1 Tax=Flavobacterium sp. I3-2 TaxID=2748319 RepID=UPI0015AD147C|nr:hypothetical protein [Flavobacterium sp. I3-2]
MKFKIYLVCVFLLFLHSDLFAQSEKKNINGIDLIFKTSKLECAAENCTEVTLFRNHLKIISHVLYFEDGDCMSATVEIGIYKIINNTIIFYSFWANYDRLPSYILPFGFRKQVYEVESNGKIKSIESQIYLETSITKNEKNKIYYDTNDYLHKGIQFLKNTPSNSYERNALIDYKKNIEREYHAKFVVDEQRTKLEKEVRKVMKKEIELATQDWIENEFFGTIKK